MVSKYEEYVVKKVSDHELGFSLDFEKDPNTRFKGLIIDITKSRPDLVALIEPGSQLKLKLEGEPDLPAVIQAYMKVNKKYMKIFPE